MRQVLSKGSGMDGKSLTFWQIYYREEQAEKLYNFAKPYFNTTFSQYFENAVISDLVPTADTDLVSVCSWRLRSKRGGSSTEILLKRAGIFELTEERIRNTDYDVAILTPRSPTHKPLAMAVNWHGKAWVDGFARLKSFLYDKCICKVPNELSNTIYENHFIAKREIYSDYVGQCLDPVLSFMRSEGGVFDADSGYLQKKRNDPEAVKDYQRVSGRQDWSIAPFLLERLFSIWIERKNFKIINL